MCGRGCAGVWCSVQGLLRIEGGGDAPREWCCAERHGWSAWGGARHAVGPTGGVRRFRGSATAMRRRVSGNGGAGGKRGSVATIAITVPIRRRRSARGPGGMAPTGGSTAFCTLGTANGTGSRERDRRRRGALAKMDALTASLPVVSGIYRLLPGAAGDLAKMAAWTVRITLVSKEYEPVAGSLACLQREDAIGAAGPP